jgi:hypothetical protein
MIGAVKDAPMSKGLFNNLGRELRSLVEKIERKEPFGIKYLSPYFPRFLWKIMAETTFWHARAYKNNLKKSDLLRKSV